MSTQLDSSEERVIDSICRAFDEAWRSGSPPQIADALGEVPSDLRPHAFEELVAIDWERRLKSGQLPDIDEYRSEFVEFADRLSDEFVARLESELEEPCRSETATAIDAPRQPLPIPETIGEFHIEREIGRGGMGIVYAARQASLDRMVALKILPTSVAQDSSLHERFLREANANAKLRHSNIAPVFGVGESDGIHFFAMDLIDGVTLSLRRQNEPTQLIGDHDTSPVIDAKSVFKVDDQAHIPAELNVLADVSNKERWQLIARLGMQVAEALDYAHGEGVLHRDIKPSNLMLDCSGRIWLMDFGLARVLDGSDLTETGSIVGTLRFIPPEVIEDGQVDAIGDVYSLGLTLYELLALRPGFDAEERPALLRQLLDETPPKLSKLVPGIPRDLATIVHKAIAREPARRYANAGELADDLRLFLDDRPIKARRVSLFERTWRWARRHPAQASLVVAVITILAVAFGATLWIQQEQNQRTQQTHDEIAGLVANTRILVNQVQQRQQLAANQPRMQPLSENSQVDVEAWLDEQIPAIRLKVTNTELLTTALDQARRARSLLSDATNADSRREMDELVASVEFELALTKFREEVERIEFFNYGLVLSVNEHSFLYKRKRSVPKVSQPYFDSFELIGISTGQSVETATARIRQFPDHFKVEVIVALNHWCLAANKETSPFREWVREVVTAVDESEWRGRFRDVILADDLDTELLRELVTSPQFAIQHPRLMVLFREFLPHHWSRLRQEILERALRIHPLYYGLNHIAASKNLSRGRFNPDSLRYATVANALRPSRTSMALLTTLLAKAEHYHDAIRVMKRVRELWPDDINAGCQLAFCEARIGDLDACLSTLNDLNQKFPNNLQVNCELGVRLKQADRLDEAEAALKKSLESPQPNEQAFKTLAEVFQETSRSPQAVDVLQAGLEVHPKSTELLFALHKQMGEAGRESEQAELSERVVAAMLARAERQVANQNKRSAWNSYWRVLQVSPGHPKARESMKRLRSEMKSRAAGRPNAAASADEN